ncbi:hypothetical protein DPMN_023581 [Dreissena polymorpha]|uniref:Potassium channel tetramerisation-type BTB domain-containing protein n=1 Tax=Dreissena polymorpha TaxID=45954 RepID=A0A9D4RBX2_DREPO|nr:hypothetical protein DPMN_023581 [Dreissena polymorpha]
MKDTLRLDISGTMFRIKKSTLQNIPTSRLANLNDLCEEYDRKSGIYIFDRDAVSFRYILNAYINGELHAPKDVCPNQFRTELDFWDIPIKLLSLCCLKHFYDGQEDIDTLQILIERSHETPLAKISTVTEPSAISSFKAWDTTTENEVKSNDAYTKMTNKNKKNVNGNVGTTRTASSAPPSLWLLLEESNSSTAAKVSKTFNSLH